MKLTTHETETTFKPITLTITFETKEELYSLWNRMKLSDLAVREAHSKYKGDAESVYKECGKGELFELFEWIDEEVISQQTSF